MAYSCAVCGAISQHKRCPAHTSQPRTRGAANQRLRAQALADHGRTCHICGHPITPTEAWHMDHVQPLAQGGTDSRGNLKPAHTRCNLTKGAT
jgi:5-methylcytosine-specific restriction endonuclease McrA